MADDPDLTKLTFTQAVAYFRRKAAVPTDRWDAIQGAESDWAFSVAAVTNADMLADLRASVDKYIAEGVSFQSFSKDFGKIAERYGWAGATPWRANLIAATNLRSSYAAGQYQQRQSPAVQRLRPGLKWVHRDSPQARPHHLALDGKVFDGSDPDYARLSAPSGFGCRCRLFSVPAPEEGYFELSDRLPYRELDGSTATVPAIPIPQPGNQPPKLYPIADPGFYYAPGAASEDRRPGILAQMIRRQPPALQAKLKALLSIP